jgi:hypothetical protein
MWLEGEKQQTQIEFGEEKSFTERSQQELRHM